MPSPPVLRGSFETERFVLKSLNILEALQVTDSWRHDDAILNGLFQSPKPISRHKWFIRGPIPRSSRRFTYSITPKGESRPIGAHAVKLNGYRSAFGTVAVHDRDWWGKDVVVEARAKLMNQFFRHAGVERFYGIVDAHNVASVFNYRKLGFTHCGTWHRHAQNPVTGAVIDFLFFEISLKQWQAGPFWEANDGR
jgi:RimJ/RimL family protein N-acetyltransferase